jgi:transposase-like protein
VEVIMGKQRQSWSIEEKVGIVLAVLSERQSVAEVSRQHGVNENQIYRWKEQFLVAGRQGLTGAKAQTVDQRLDAENSQLKKLLGEKALEIEILKKPPGFEGGDTSAALSSV